MYGVSLDGGLADEIVVAADAVIPVPPSLPTKAAAIAEPLAVGVHGLNRVGAVAGQRVLVIGAGSIGLLAVAALRARGVAPDLVARHPAQQTAGEALGATLRTGVDYDVVVEAAGAQSSLDLALESARPGGSVLVLSSFWTPVQLDTGFGMKEVSLVPASTYGHHHGRREFLDAVDILVADPGIADVLVTHEFGLDDAAEAFRVAGDRASGALKVLLTP
jgi:2-desacetyl-2-hydroxyethyl bacteriochlorophyllide A dehydrogenase